MRDAPQLPDLGRRILMGQVLVEELAAAESKLKSALSLTVEYSQLAASPPAPPAFTPTTHAAACLACPLPRQPACVPHMVRSEAAAPHAAPNMGHQDTAALAHLRNGYAFTPNPLSCSPRSSLLPPTLAPLASRCEARALCL